MASVLTCNFVYKNIFIFLVPWCCSTAHILVQLAETLTLFFPGRMKPRCRLSAVDRLPTISEMHECCSGDGDVDCPSHTMEAYVESIKELSQPALYPLHGPLRGHRRWPERSGTRAAVVRTPSLFLNSSRTFAPWTPVELSDVSVTLTSQASCDLPPRLNENLLDRLVGQSVFAGLAWPRPG